MGAKESVEGCLTCRILITLRETKHPMKSHTKEFWQQVKEEHQNAKPGLREYLCNCSNAFYYAWKEHKDDLRDIGADFLIDSPQWYSIIKLGHYEGSVLFMPIDCLVRDLSPQERVAVRDDFIEWNLKKTTLQPA